MWVVAWETRSGHPRQTEAPSETAADVRVRNLKASGITRVTYYEIGETE